MSHYIENMFSVGEVPWHGLGTVLEDPPKIEDAIRLAGLDWEVQMDDVEIKSKVLDLSVTLPAPKFKGLVRIGNNHLSSQVYAVVSDV